MTKKLTLKKLNDAIDGLIYQGETNGWTNELRLKYRKFCKFHRSITA